MTTTKDIYFAALLLAYGYKLDSVLIDDPRHQEFIFDVDHDAVRELKTAYANQTIQVNAWQFKEAIQRMKFIVHNKI